MLKRVDELVENPLHQLDVPIGALYVNRRAVGGQTWNSRGRWLTGIDAGNVSRPR